MFRERVGRRIAGASLLVGLGASSLAGCAGTNKNVISHCPAGYATPAVEVKDIPTSHLNMQVGVRTFIADLPEAARDTSVDQDVFLIALSPAEQSAIPVLMNNEGFDTAEYDTTSLKIGAIGQEFCNYGGNTYASPAYVAAQAALKVAGITVELNQAAAIHPASNS